MRKALAVCLAAAIGCGPGPDPQPGGGGPAFLINSPIDGGSIAGVVWFSVQLDDPAAVAGVRFTAGGKDVMPAGTRAFLVARDYPPGPLALEATVTGIDGKTSTRSIQVTNVPDPPSTAIVGPGGAVLGAAEIDGSISTLAIEPGDAAGATVTFATRTKDEVKA